MKRNSSIEQGRLSQRGKGVGTVTEAMVRKRARQIALINGRPGHQVLDSDLEEARQELTGRERIVPPESAAEELTESSRWVQVPASQGHEAPTVSPPDEQTFAEELTEEGVSDAEEEQMLQAAKAARRQDRNG